MFKKIKEFFFGPDEYVFENTLTPDENGKFDKEDVENVMKELNEFRNKEQKRTAARAAVGGVAIGAGVVALVVAIAEALDD